MLTTTTTLLFISIGNSKKVNETYTRMILLSCKRQTSKALFHLPWLKNTERPAQLILNYKISCFKRHKQREARMDSISHWLCSRTLKKLLCFSHFCFSNEVISKHRLVLSRLMPPLTILRTHPPRVFQTNSRRQKGNNGNLANHILLKGFFAE